MKKTVLAMGGFIALGALCYVGQSAGQAQQNGQPQANVPQPPRTRIALINLTYVVKKYDKYVRFEEEVKALTEPFKKKDMELRQQLEILRKKAGDPPPQGANGVPPELERQAKDIQRQMEDNVAEAKLQLSKRSDNEMKILFLDVYEAAQRYATSHDFDLVLQYNDAVTKDDFLSTANIQRKLNTGALMMLYSVAGMDISVEVANVLNYNARATGAPNGAPGSAPPTGGNN